MIMSIVMVLGIAPSATALTTSADYADAGDIVNLEAVDVLSAVRVVEGIGSVGARAFHPRREVNRAEAAAIIARLLLGRDNADALTMAATIFSDVHASHWASGYINWCVAQGIVSGYSSGRFGPRDSVTVTQFTAMLLRAVGYGSRGEYEGSSWESNVIADGIREGMLSSGASYREPANRDRTALLAFNAMFIELVQWNSTTSIYDQADNDPSKTNTILSSVYPTLSFSPADPDQSGNQRITWKLGGETIGTYVAGPGAATGRLEFAYVRGISHTPGTGTVPPVFRVDIVYFDGSTAIRDLSVRTAGTGSPAGAVYFGATANGNDAINPGDLYVNFPDYNGNPRYYYMGGRTANQPAGGGTAEYLIEAILGVRVVSWRMTGGRIDLSMQLKSDSEEAIRAGNGLEFVFRRDTPSISPYVNIGAAANSHTMLISIIGGVSQRFSGINTFPSGVNGWSVKTDHTPEPGNRIVDVVYIRSGTTISNILVVGAFFLSGPRLAGFAVWNGETRNAQSGREYRLFVNGTFDWFLIEDDEAPEAGTVRNTVYEFFFDTPNNTASLGDTTYSDVIKIDSMDEGYFISSGVPQMYAPDCKVYDIRDTANSANWRAVSLSTLQRDMQVIAATATVDGVDDVAVAIFIYA